MHLSSGSGGARRPQRRWTIATIYLVRHGETQWNQEKRLQGGIDIPLNDRGQRQAEALARRLEGCPLDRIFTSDLARAAETAERIAARQRKAIPVVRTPDLRESQYGFWEGLTRKEIAERFSAEWSAWLSGGGLGRIPGGEDYAAMAGRAAGVYAAAAQAGERVLICSHHGPIQAILCHALGIGEALRGRFLILNCSLNALEIPPEGPTRLILLNDTTHLDGLA